MKEELYENLRQATFILWQYANNSDNALGLWNCTEEIALIFESNNIRSTEDIDSILELGTSSPIYVDFMRLISYRIYTYTYDNDTFRNWFAGEKVLGNGEWKNAILNVVRIYAMIPFNPELLKSLRSDVVKDYYNGKIQQMN